MYVCHTCYLELHRFSTIHHCLSEDATKTLTCAFILSSLSRLDYCNAVLSCCPKHLLDRLKKIQNDAARLTYQSSRFNHVTPLLHTLRWLPVEKRIDFKLASLCFKPLNGSVPYPPLRLSSFLHSFSTAPFSADTRVFIIPSFRTKSSGQRSFS